MPGPDHRDVLVVGGDLAGTAAALAAVRSGARVRLLVQGGRPPGDVQPIPENPAPVARETSEGSRVEPPEEMTVFRFRARRVRRWLEELGIENDEAWATNLYDAIRERLEREGAAVDETSVAVRPIGDAETGISGAVLVDGEDSTAQRADTTILAGGGVRYLWPVDGDEPSPPAGWALALRAGLPMADPGDVAWRETDDGPVPHRFVGGVGGDGRGHTEVPGVAACGEVLASPFHAEPQLSYLEDVIRGLEAGDFQGPPADPADPELVPLVDEPMPPGFANVKLGRLRGTMAKQAARDADAGTLEKGYETLLTLRGEFADYARARAQTDIQVLHQCADVALAHLDARVDS